MNIHVLLEAYQLWIQHFEKYEYRDHLGPIPAKCGNPTKHGGKCHDKNGAFNAVTCFTASFDYARMKGKREQKVMSYPKNTVRGYFRRERQMPPWDKWRDFSMNRLNADVPHTLVQGPWDEDKRMLLFFLIMGGASFSFLQEWDVRTS
jgi:hypothetical protein